MPARLPHSTLLSQHSFTQICKALVNVHPFSSPISLPLRKKFLFTLSHHLSFATFPHMNFESPPIRPLNILLAEDDPEFQSTLASYLIAHHHSVRCASDVQSALQLLAEAPCEVLISDIGFPDGTGWFLLNQAGPRLCPYAIAISGFHDPVDLEDSARVGFQKHLIKPLSFIDLESALIEATAALPPPLA